MDSIILYCNGRNFKITKEPFETNEDVYKRGWFIIKNYNNISDYNELISRSIIYINEKNNMVYSI